MSNIATLAKENKTLLEQLGSHSNDIKILNKLALMSYSYNSSEINQNTLPFIIEQSNEIAEIVGYEILNNSNNIIKNIKYLDIDCSIKSKDLKPNESMLIQISFLGLLLSRPEYSYRTQDNVFKSDNYKEPNIDILLNSYSFENQVPTKKIGIKNIFSNEELLLNQYKTFKPIHYVSNKQDIYPTAKTAQYIAQLIKR